MEMMDTSQNEISMSPRNLAPHEHSAAPPPMPRRTSEIQRLIEYGTPERIAHPMNGRITPVKTCQHPHNWNQITWAPKVSH